tara:strand:- start:5917 stop:6348 length:432 start_codon:yes stop_codon:yes gene_type:complete
LFEGDVGRAQDMHQTILDAVGLDFYQEKYVQLMYNLRRNPALLQKDAQTLVRMTDVELAKGTDTEKHMERQARKRRKLQRVVKSCIHIFGQVEDEGGEDDVEWIRCKRCKTTNVSWTQKQTKCADEPMNVYCTCEKCGSRWVI